MLRGIFPSSPTLAAILLLAAILFGMAAHKPLHLDNMDFPAAAAATSQSWLPIYYRGEQAPRYQALYHPPLFIYMLAVWMKAFGTTAESARFFGFTCLLVFGAVTCVLFRQLLGRPLRRQTLVWFWLLFLLNPYTLQGASIVDIDTTVYGPMLAIVTLLAFRIQTDGVRGTSAGVPFWRWGALSLAICCAFWMKMTTVLLLLPSLWMIFIPAWGLRTSLWRALGAFVAGLGLFIGSYHLYGLATGLNIGFSYSFVWQSAMQKGGFGTSNLVDWFFQRSAQMLGTFTGLSAWTGLFFWGLLPVSAIRLVRRLRQELTIPDWNLLTIHLICLAGTAWYCFQTMTFGGAPFKYTFVFWPAVVMIGAMSAAQVASALKGDSVVRPWLTWLVAAGFYLFAAVAVLGLVKDTLINGDVRSWRGLIVLGIPALLVMAGLWAQRSRLVPAACLVVGVLAGGGISLGVAIHQARADYATTYDYRQRGFEETVAFIRLNTRKDEVIASMKDIGYAAQRRFHENYAAIYGPDSRASELMDAVMSGKVRYAIFTENHGQDQLSVKPILRDWVNSRCRLVKSLGDYRIYEYVDGFPESPK